MLLVQFLVKTYRCFVLYVLAEDFDGISVSYEWEIKYKIIIASTSKYKRKNIGRGVLWKSRCLWSWYLYSIYKLWEFGVVQTITQYLKHWITLLPWYITQSHRFKTGPTLLNLLFLSLQHRARFVETAVPIYQRELHKSGDKYLFSPCRLLKTYWNHNDII